MEENKYGTLSFFDNNAYDTLDRESLNGAMENKNEEEKGLIEKAIGYSKKGAENLQKGFKATLNKANFTNNSNFNYPGSSNSTAAETESVFSSFSKFSLYSSNNSNNNNANQNRNKTTSSFGSVATLLSYKNFPIFCILFAVSAIFFFFSSFYFTNDSYIT